MKQTGIHADTEDGRKIARRLSAYWNLISDFKFDEIFEPTQMLCIEGDEEKVLIHSPDMLKSWMLEVCYSFVVKSANTENALRLHFNAGDLYTTLILLRHHMELCGFITLSLDKFLIYLKNDDEAILSKYIAETSFGSAYKNNKKTRDRAESLMGAKPPSSASFIKALDRFINELGGGKENNALFTNNYAFLCHFAHPNSLSASFFVDSDEVDNGHLIRFHYSQIPKSTTSETSILRMLEYNIVAGYTSLFVFLAHRVLEDAIEIDHNKIMKAKTDIFGIFHGDTK